MVQAPPAAANHTQFVASPPEHGCASRDAGAHRHGRQSRSGVEALTKLDALSAVHALPFVGAPKVRDGTGSPRRIVALV